MAHLQGTRNPSKPSKICSVLRVDKEVDFLLDEDDITYLATVPTTRTIEDSTKSYAKDNLTYNPCISFVEPIIEKNDVPDKKKRISFSSSLYTNKSVPQKRKSNTITDSSNVVISKKIKKDHLKNSKPFIKNNGHQSAQMEIKAGRNNRSSDPDVKILKVFPHPSKSDLNGKRLQSLKNSVRNKTVVTKLNSNFLKQNPAIKQLPQSNCKPFLLADNGNSINEADTAPLIGPELFPDMCSNEAVCDVTNRSQIKWLSTNGTKGFSNFPNGGSSTKQFPTSCSEKSDVLSLETKTGATKKKRRELEKLYASLNEISWAHENTFKRLLNNDEMKNTRKATAISLGKNQGRILRNVKELKSKNQNVKKVAKRKGKLNRVLKTKQNIQNKNILLNNIKQRNLNCSSMVKQADKIKKRIYQDIKMKAKNDKVPSTKSKLNKSLKVTCPKKITKKSNAALKTKFGHSMKVKKMATGVKRNKIIKATCNSTNKKVQCHTKMKVNKPTVKSKLLNSRMGLNEAMSSLMVQKEEAPETSSNRFQKYNKKTSAKSETCTVSSNKTTVIKSAIKKFEKVEISNQIDLFKRFLSEDSNLFTALQQGSKLRVSLEPLEHTSHWNSTFYEEFKNQVLTQAFCKTLEMENQDSLRSMFRNLDEVIFNQKNDDKMSKKRKTEEESLRSSVRQIEGSYRYKEIVVKRHNCYLQVVIVPNVSKRNCLSIETMKELKEAFLLAKKDSTLRAVLLSSSGPFFCGGIDLSQLIGDYKKQMADEMSLVMRDLVLAISSVSKPIIAAVNGSTIGFGVAILALCDIVLASDKATFSIPATKLGYVPEGGLSLTLPQVIGSGRASELLLQGRRFTAAQALSFGFVSEIMWPTRLMNDLIPRLDALLSHPPQAMEATKSMVRSHLWDKLKTQIEKEWRMLPPLWLSAECQNNIKKMLKTRWLDD